MGEMMEHNKRTKTAYENYKDFNTSELWNELTAADQHITEYILCRKYPENKVALKISREKEKIFFEALEESRALIRLLKEKPKNEIYKVYEYLKSKFYVANEKGKKNIQSHLGFIEKELL